MSVRYSTELAGFSIENKIIFRYNDNRHLLFKINR